VGSYCLSLYGARIRTQEELLPAGSTEGENGKTPIHFSLTTKRAYRALYEAMGLAGSHVKRATPTRELITRLRIAMLVLLDLTFGFQNHDCPWHGYTSGVDSSHPINIK